MVSTISQSSDPTYEEVIEFSTPRKSAYVRQIDNIDAHSNVKRDRKGKDVHAGSCHSASIRSGSGSTVVADWLVVYNCIASAKHGQSSRQAGLVSSGSYRAGSA